MEILLVQRAKQLRFMGGMYVFPGGAVHAADADPALLARIARAALGWGAALPPVTDPAAEQSPRPERAPDEPLDLREAQAYAVAAIRETCEEAGILLGVPGASRQQVELVRRLLLSDADLRVALDAIDVRIDLASLTPLSRWITPSTQPIRFDTRFYVACSPSDQDASADGTESSGLVWLSPARAIAEHRAGALRLSPPTRCTLEDLEEMSSVTQLIAYAASRPAPCIEPMAAQIDGRTMVLFPGDPEHPVRERALRGPTRRPV